jgi:1-acyl-sn-glycerol-3-phosphate acyltransferase
MPPSSAAEEFVAARPSPLVRGFFCRTLPLLLPRLGVVGVDYDENDLARVRALAGERVLLVPNHPTNTEPAILFHLSCRVGQPFHFLACREAFEPLWGAWGQVIRRVGAFSVVRGTADRASFRATRDLLAGQKSKLVVFPEGEVYSQNDTLLPFNAGIFQLAFWALDDLRKASGGEAPLYVLPVALKYRFVRDMSGAIRASLARLERFNGLPVDRAGGSYDRLRRIGLTMLRSVEQEYRLPTPTGEDAEADLTPRMTAIKEAILQRVATAAGLPLPKGDTLPDRMRTLIHHVEEVTEGEPERRAAPTPYERALHHEKRERARPLLRDLKRLANYIALTDNYVRADPTPERMADTLQRLERESFGRAILDGPRRCRVRIGEPINLAERYADYQKAKRAEVARVTHEVESQVLALLRGTVAAVAAPGGAGTVQDRA